MIHEHEGGLAVLPPHLLGIVLHASLTQNQLLYTNVSDADMDPHGSRNNFVLLDPDPDPGAIQMQKCPAIQKIVYLPRHTTLEPRYPYVGHDKCENFNFSKTAKPCHLPGSESSAFICFLG